MGGGGMGVGGVVFRLPLPATLTSTPPPASLPVCGRSSSHIIMAITFFYRFSIDLFFILLTFNYHVLYCLLYSRSSLPFVSSLLPLVFVPSHICVDLPSSRLPPFLSIFLFNSTFACFSLLGFRFSYLYSSLTCFFHVEKQAWQ